MRLLCVCFLVVSYCALGQSKPDSLRSYYIQEYRDYFFVWPVLKQRTLSFEVIDKSEKKESVEFIPNNKFALGVGFYVFELGVELAFAVPINEANKELYGESSARDLQINVLAKRWGADAYYQKYEGYYVDDNRVQVPPGTAYPQRSDITTKNFGISGVYVFNHRKFSLRSAYNFAERQLRSKGSFVLYGTVNSFELSADSAVLTPAAVNDLGAGANFRSLRYTTLSIGPGYSYNLIWKKFFLNFTLAFGPAHHWTKYTEENGPTHEDISINSAGSIRLGLGYNGDRFFGGVGFTVQGRTVKFEDVKFTNTSNSFRFMIGYRFKEFGILKKRAVDFIPFDI